MIDLTVSADTEHLFCCNEERHTVPADCYFIDAPGHPESAKLTDEILGWYRAKANSKTITTVLTAREVMLLEMALFGYRSSAIRLAEAGKPDMRETFAKQATEWEEIITKLGL